MWTALRNRRRAPEIMDDPGLDAARHTHALAGLGRINRLSGSARLLWTPISAWIRAQSESRPQGRGRETAPPRVWRVLDLATGGGDVPLALWRKARRAGLPLRIDGCDLSPRAVEYARSRAARAGADVRFFTRDALAGELPGDYDILTTSLFLHHLDEEQAVALLRSMARAARGLVLVNDLRRSAAGWLLAYFGTRCLTTSPVVHFDGPLSVRAALTLPEVRALAARAGLAGARVARRWPCRYLLSWKRTNA